MDDAKQIAQALSTAQALITWAINRGITRERIQAMLDDAGENDITSDQVQTELDSLKSELDDTGRLIDDS